jgi:hypothetical protein
MMPLIGTKSHHVRVTEADYIELADFTGRELHPAGERIRINSAQS